MLDRGGGDGFRIVNSHNRNIANSTSIVSPPKHSFSMPNPYSALAGTAASHNNLDEMAILHCDTPVPEFEPHVKVSNSNMVIPIVQTKMHLSNELSATAHHAYIFDNLATGSLISIGKLCDDNCLELFSKYSFKILKNKKVVATEKRNKNGLWDIPLSSISEHLSENVPTPNTSTPVANGVLHLDQTKQEFAQYLSAIYMGPVSSTLLRAIRKKHMTTWSGLTINLINKHLLKLIYIAKGHLDQEAKNLRSTKTYQKQ